ncbi:N-acetylglucosamine-6-phosphate deacetylase [Enterococcus sp. BWB1-3]|uniref:N-acetylglucosamine-6-phosphate deacetylase n=1 Tax=unclassified Enterococcus TaxID=2608891 RepID=UPI001920DD0E|nr:MULTISPECIES: N-acetylglucosamine-6-phosphate deacetylase [unclassified Enterococcus]MBL1228674.1 N-acetylglucosamine-6-phosphate deacetylase [Enterococcus sp. BWB1-3]MCB5952745.1 N-acetylglucosamine-6-phosphate deacetylase [Enterococcus sp. BWT-B8]
MNNYYLKADRFFLKSGRASAGYLEVSNGKFGNFTKEKPEGEILDYSGKWIAPGLVDTHIHGFMGYDVMDNNFEGIKKMSKGLLSCGVTSFLPTTLTADIDTLNEVAASIGSRYQEVEGAKIQGIFFEGPFFTEEHKGAQNPDYFSDPNIDVFNHWQKLSNGLIRKIALAPERRGAADFIREVTKQGVTVALAHSAATYNQAKEAVYAGASMFVHTYNGMSGLSHRDPGMVGAAMTSEAVIAELICDGHHVHPGAADVLMKVKTSGKIALITDCMRAGGMPAGEYTLGEFPVIVKDGAARLQSNDSLAGSVLQLFDGVKNVVDWDLATVEEAIKMASLVPAQSVHIDDQCGSIEAGLPADFLIIGPDMSLLETYLEGQSVYMCSKEQE